MNSSDSECESLPQQTIDPFSLESRAKPNSQVTVSARQKLSPKRATSQPPSRGRNRQFEPREGLQPSRKMPEARPPTVEDDEDDYIETAVVDNGSIEEEDGQYILDSDGYTSDDNNFRTNHNEIYSSRETSMYLGGSELIEPTITINLEENTETNGEVQNLNETYVVEPDVKSALTTDINDNKAIPSPQTPENRCESDRIVLMERYTRDGLKHRTNSRRFKESHCETLWEGVHSKMEETNLLKVRNATSQNRKRNFNAVDSESIMYDPLHWKLRDGRLFLRGETSNPYQCTHSIKRFRTISTEDRQSFLASTPEAGNYGRRRRRSQKKSRNEDKPNSSRVGEQYQADVPDYKTQSRHYYCQEENQPQMIWDAKRALEAERRGEDIEGFMKKAEKFLQGSKGSYQVKDLNLTMRVMEALHKGEYCVKQALKEFVKMHHKDPVYSVDLSSKQESQFIKLSHDLIGREKKFGTAASIMGCKAEAVQVRYYRWKADQRAEYSKLKRERKKESDECEICRDGGFLIVCELCRKAFHRECLNPPLEEMPDHDWYCKRCTHSSPARLRRLHCTSEAEKSSEIISPFRLTKDSSQQRNPRRESNVAALSSELRNGFEQKRDSLTQRKVALLSVHKELSPHHKNNTNQHLSTNTFVGAVTNTMAYGGHQGNWPNGGMIHWSGNMLRQPLGFGNPTCGQLVGSTEKYAISMDSSSKSDSKVSYLQSIEDGIDVSSRGIGVPTTLGKQSNNCAYESKSTANDSIVVRKAIDQFTYETKLVFSPDGLLSINIGYVEGKKDKKVCFLGYTKDRHGNCAQTERNRAFHGVGDIFVSLSGISCTDQNIGGIKGILRKLYKEDPKRAVIAVMKYADAQDVRVGIEDNNPSKSATYLQSQPLHQKHNRPLLQNDGPSFHTQTQTMAGNGRNESSKANSAAAFQPNSFFHSKQNGVPNPIPLSNQAPGGIFQSTVGQHHHPLSNPYPGQQDLQLESTLSNMKIPHFILFLRYNNIHTTNAFLNSDVLMLAKALSASNGCTENVAIDYICSIRMHLRQLLDKQSKKR